MFSRITTTLLAAAATVVATVMAQPPAAFAVPYPAPGFYAPTVVWRPTGWNGKNPGACDVLPNDNGSARLVGLPSSIIGQYKNANCGRTVDIVATDNKTIIATEVTIVDSTSSPDLMVLSNAVWNDIKTGPWNVGQFNENKTIGGWRYTDGLPSRTSQI